MNRRSFMKALSAIFAGAAGVTHPSVANEEKPLPKPGDELVDYVAGDVVSAGDVIVNGRIPIGIAVRDARGGETVTIMVNGLINANH